MTGVEAQKIVPFATVRQRVQIGMTFAGGIAYFKGTVEQTRYRVVGSFEQVAVEETSETIPAKEVAKDALGLDFLPLGRVELTVAAMRPAI